MMCTASASRIEMWGRIVHVDGGGALPALRRRKDHLSLNSARRRGAQ